MNDMKINSVVPTLYLLGEGDFENPDDLYAYFWHIRPLHLRSIHPLWTILQKMKNRECEFSNTTTFRVIFELSLS